MAELNRLGLEHFGFGVEDLEAELDRFLDEAEEAAAVSDWATVGDRARDVLRLDPENRDALSYLAASERDTENSQPAQASPALPKSDPIRRSTHLLRQRPLSGEANWGSAGGLQTERRG